MRTVTRQIIRSARRARQWTIINQNTTLNSMGSIVDLSSALETSLGSNLHNSTVSALRLTFDFHFADASTIGDRVLAYFGVMWATNDAIAAGVASLPDPIVDSADWIMHGTRLLVSGSTALHQPRNAHMDFFGDSQRKQRENNSSLVLIAKNQVSDHGVQLFIGGRVLFILP